MRLVIPLFTLLFVLCPAVLLAEQPTIDETRANLAESADNLARCAGIYLAFSEVYDEYGASDLKAMSEMSRGLYNGAAIAATFLYFQANTEGPGRPKDWYWMTERTVYKHKVAAKVGITKTSDSNDLKYYTDEVRKCRAKYDAVVDAIINKMETEAHK